ncbi:MAG: histidine phosphatase family protein [Pseudomonadota bacterium]
MQLILIRHGEPDLSHGTEDPPLSTRGRRQASETAGRLALEPIDRIITSPLLRARQTADALASRTKLEVEVAEGVAEVDRWGASYVSVEALRRQGGQPWANFLADPVGTLGGDEQLFRREVTSALQDIAHSTRGRTAVATHGLPINLILAELLGLKGLTNFAPHHASVTRLHIGLGGKMSVLSVNEVTHLNRDDS